jgi:hypothetical protein
MYVKSLFVLFALCLAASSTVASSQAHCETSCTEILSQCKFSERGCAILKEDCVRDCLSLPS